jgi:hypothetical protein
MNVKISLLLAAFGGASLVGGASALPIANMPSNMVVQTLVRDDEGGEIARQIMHGATGRDGDRHRHRHRDHDHGRGWGHRDHRDGERGPRSHRHDD